MCEIQCDPGTRPVVRRFSRDNHCQSQFLRVLNWRVLITTWKKSGWSTLIGLDKECKETQSDRTSGWRVGVRSTGIKDGEDFETSHGIFFCVHRATTLAFLSLQVFFLVTTHLKHNPLKKKMNCFDGIIMRGAHRFAVIKVIKIICAKHMHLSGFAISVFEPTFDRIFIPRPSHFPLASLPPCSFVPRSSLLSAVHVLRRLHVMRWARMACLMPANSSHMRWVCVCFDPPFACTCILLEKDDRWWDRCRLF